MQSLVEIGFVLHRFSADLLVLNLFPDVLIGIALGRVTGKKKYSELMPMSSHKVPNLLRMMKRDAIDQQNQRTRAPLQQLLQKGDVAFRIHCACFDVVAQMAHRFHRRQDNKLPRRKRRGIRRDLTACPHGASYRFCLAALHNLQSLFHHRVYRPYLRNSHLSKIRHPIIVF